jgi:hypothetical protein
MLISSEKIYLLRITVGCIILKRKLWKGCLIMEHDFYENYYQCEDVTMYTVYDYTLSGDGASEDEAREAANGIDWRGVSYS